MACIAGMFFPNILFICFAEKIQYSTRIKFRKSSPLCPGIIVRVDWELVFQRKNFMTPYQVSYKKENRPPVSDYVRIQEVVPSEVTPGKTVVYYEDRYNCLLKGKVTSFDKQNEIYTIDGKTRKRGSEVRYSEGHGEA